jgi:hypothetical protein
MRMVRTLVLTALLVLAVAPAAGAAQRYAAPNGSTTGQCPVAVPCALDRAVNNAADGDEVIVAPGTYTLAKKLQPSGDLDLHGDPDGAWPKIVGTGSLKEPILTLDGGTLAHVLIHAAADKEALVLREGVVDGVRLESAAADAATVYGSDATVIRNSVVVSKGSKDAAALWLRDGSGANSVEIRNVTAMATAGTADGIHCDLTSGGSATILNSIARGTGFDLDFTPACRVAFSNFRPAFSTGVAPGTGNQSAEPLFADDQYRPAAGSPTIDAGALDALSRSPDPDGRPRGLGAAPDIGAYEYVPPATPSDDADGELPDDLKGVPLPQQGRTVVVAAASGTVRVRRPGAERFTKLAEPGRIPVGSLVDARAGRVRLVTEIDGDRVQMGTFWGSKFATGQRRSGGGMTTLTLRGGDFSACRTQPAHSAIAFAGRTRKKARRGLWARDNGGRFRTHGNDSVATARGTAWYTEDRCSGTYTRVKEGAVAVRDLVRHKTVLVKAGHSYVARKHR